MQYMRRMSSAVDRFDSAFCDASDGVVGDADRCPETEHEDDLEPSDGCDHDVHQHGDGSEIAADDDGLSLGWIEAVPSWSGDVGPAVATSDAGRRACRRKTSGESGGASVCPVAERQQKGHDPTRRRSLVEPVVATALLVEGRQLGSVIALDAFEQVLPGQRPNLDSVQHR